MVYEEEVVEVIIYEGPSILKEDLLLVRQWLGWTTWSVRGSGQRAERGREGCEKENLSLKEQGRKARNHNIQELVVEDVDMQSLIGRGMVLKALAT